MTSEYETQLHDLSQKLKRGELQLEDYEATVFELISRNHASNDEVLVSGFYFKVSDYVLLSYSSTHWLFTSTKLCFCFSEEYHIV
jgi:hypothetical protein